MSSENDLDLVYLPDGRINAPYILANANLLLKSGEYQLAVSLFRRIQDHPKYGYCGYYGVGQCYFLLQHWSRARTAFEKALALAHRPYIVESLQKTIQMQNQNSPLQGTIQEKSE